MLVTEDILELIDDIFPFSLAEPWDNSGLQAGGLTWPVRRIVVSLDVTMPVLESAAKWEADMVVTHHPLLMKGQKQLNFQKMPGSAVGFAAINNISIISAHTNLDKAWKGLNDYVADKIGLQVDSALVPDNSLKKSNSNEISGLGRICTLNEPKDTESLVSLIKKTLDLPNLIAAGHFHEKIQTIALCTGSGGSLVNDFLQSDAQVYITGDLKYHEARTIENQGKLALDIGHFGSEILAVDLLVEKIGQVADQKSYPLEIKGYLYEEDPFIIL